MKYGIPDAHPVLFSDLMEPRNGKHVTFCMRCKRRRVYFHSEILADKKAFSQYRHVWKCPDHPADEGVWMETKDR